MRARRRWPRILVRTCAVLVLVPLVLMIYLGTVGIPAPLVNRIIEGADERGFLLEMRSTRLDPFRGIVIRDVRLFRKGIVGPPAVEVGELTLAFDIIRCSRDVGRLRRVSMKNGFFRRDTPWDAFSAFKSKKPALAKDIAIELEKFELQGLWFESLSCGIKTVGNSTWISNIESITGRGDGAGPLAGWIAWEKGSKGFRGHLTGLFDLREILEFLHARNIRGPANVLETFAFDRNVPRLELFFSGTVGRGWTHSLTGGFAGRHFQHNGIDVLAATSPIEIEFLPVDREVVLDPLSIQRAEGSAKLTLAVDLTAATVTFEGSSTLDPNDAAVLIHPTGPKYIKSFRFAGGAVVDAAGRLCYTNAGDCEIDAEAEVASVGFGPFTTAKCKFTFNKSGHRTSLSNLDAAVCGGHLRGSGSFLPETTSTNMRYDIDCVIDDMDFRVVAETMIEGMKDVEGYSGRLSAKVKASGVARRDRMKETEASGEFRISKGRIFRIPIFGGLSEMLVAVVPGLGYVLRQTDAEAEFVVTDGRVTTDELRIEGDILSVKAGGDYYLADNKLDYDVELRFLKKKTYVGAILQTVMFPFTRLFRVGLEGTLEDPKWRPLNF